MRSLMHSKRIKIALVTFVVFVLAFAFVKYKVFGKDVKGVTATSNTVLYLDGSPATYGAVDIIRLAISLGGYTTYTDNSSLIGATVTQEFSDGVLVREEIRTSDRNIRANNSAGYGSLSLEVDKTADSFEYRLSTSNSKLMEKLIPEIFQVSQVEQVVSLLGSLNWNNKANSTTTVNFGNGGVLRIGNDGCRVTYKLPGNAEMLQNESDFITTKDFINKWEPFRYLDKIGLESELLGNPQSWSDEVTTALGDYEIKQRTYTITYAPSDAGPKTANINDWNINNYNQSTQFISKTTGQAFDYYVTTVSPDNIYKDTREYVSLLGIGNIVDPTINRLVQLFYGDRQPKEYAGMEELYNVQENGNISHVIKQRRN